MRELAGHSFGGLYVLTFTAPYPDEVAGMVLVDSTAPAADARTSTPDAAGSIEIMNRVSALASAAARLATVSQVQTSIDEYARGGSSAQHAPALDDLGDKPLFVLTPCLVGSSAVVLFVSVHHDRRLSRSTLPRGRSGRWSGRSTSIHVATTTSRGRSSAASCWWRLMRCSSPTRRTTCSSVGVDEADVPYRVYLGTLVQSLALVAVSPFAGRMSDRSGRRKVFVIVAAVLYGVALFVIAGATSVEGYVVGMGLGGVAFGMYMAVDLALVVDVLPDTGSAAKDLGVLNIAGAPPFAVVPAFATALLALGGGGYAVLYAVAGAVALGGAGAVVPIKGVR